MRLRVLVVDRVLGALLLLVAALLPTIALWKCRRPAERVQLAVTLRAVRGDVALTPPVTVLYVSRRCAYCEQAARRFDALAGRRRSRALIVTADPEDSARAFATWAATLGLSHVALALDTGRHLAQAVGLRAVPASIAANGAVQYGPTP